MTAAERQRRQRQRQGALPCPTSDTPATDVPDIGNAAPTAEIPQLPAAPEIEVEPDTPDGYVVIHCTALRAAKKLVKEWPDARLGRLI
jgi:hypothetical protein